MSHRKNLSISAIVVFLLLSIWPRDAGSWGFWAHRRINRIAVFTLPPEMIGFYKSHINFMTEKSVNPDKRRYAIKAEAPRHYIDIDHYGEYPFNNVPREWDKAVAKFTEDTLQQYGIVPWHVVRMKNWLENAFRERDRDQILRLSADIGHYIGDAHVPLHTTLNYDGQLTGQDGIHGLWESRLPELLGDTYNYFVGEIRYVEDPLQTIWEVVLASHSKKDSVLRLERQLDEQFPDDKRFSYIKRGQSTVVKTFSKEYAQAYSDSLNGMVERRMRKAIRTTGSFIFTAWVDAGQPDLSKLRKDLSEEEQQIIEEEYEEYLKDDEQEDKDNNDEEKEDQPNNVRPHPDSGEDIFDP